MEMVKPEAEYRLRNSDSKRIETAMSTGLLEEIMSESRSEENNISAMIIMYPTKRGTADQDGDAQLLPSTSKQR